MNENNGYNVATENNYRQQAKINLTNEEIKIKKKEAEEEEKMSNKPNE